MLSGATYNVFLGMNLKSLLEWLYIENEPLDFCCFQEFPERQIPDLKVYLDKLGYDFQFAPGFVRYDVTYGELTVFKSSKLQLLEVETISLGGKGERNVVFTHNGLKLFRIDDTLIDKSALLTRFQSGDNNITIVNAHLSTDLHNARKLKQLNMILGSIPKTESAVILGDFNYAIGKRELKKLMNGHGFESALKKQKTFRFAPGIAWQNDYIFYRGCEIKDVSVKDVSHSDHYPIFFKSIP